MKLIHQDRGSAMIEVSLILPFFILMLVGVVDFGLVLQEAMLVADSARVGAEFGLQRANAVNLAGMKAAATASAGKVPGYSVVAANVCSCGPGGAAVSCSGTCAGYGQPTQYAEVTAKANLPLIFSMQGFQPSIPVQSIAKVRTAWVNPACPTC